MASTLKRFLTGALALCCLASSAAAGSHLRSDNILEARLGGERLILMPHIAKASNSYIASAVHFSADAMLIPLAGTTTTPATFGPTTGSTFALVSSCTGVSAGYSVIVPAASAAAPVIGTVSTCTSNGLTLNANATATAAGGSIVIFASSAVTQSTAVGATALSGTSLTLASGVCPSGYAGMSVIDSNVPTAPVIGTISACSAGVLTIGAAAHAVVSGDNIEVVTIVTPTTTVETKIVSTNHYLLVNSCTGVVNGTSIVDSGYSTTPLVVGQALRTGSPCTGSSAPYLLSIDSSNGAYAQKNSQPNDTISYTAPVGADSCHMVFSGWRRNGVGTGTYSVTPFTIGTDVISGMATPNGGSSENIIGLDIVQDGTGLRLSVGDANAVTAGNHEVSVSIPLATQLTVNPWGQWVHFLLSLNTCGSNTQYTQLYLNGVQQSLFSSGNNSTATFNSTGIAFSNPSGAFGINSPAPVDNMSFGEFADVELWTGFDLVCGAPGTSATGCLSNNTISPTDRAKFIDDSGKPIAPAIRNAWYASHLGASPLVQFTGSASQFVTNAGTGAAYSLIKATPSSTGWGGVTDVTSTPSFASATNPSGQTPTSPLGYKWACGVSQAGTNTYTGYGCGNTYAANDLIIVAYTGAYSSAPGSSPTCTPASGWTSIDASSGYNSSGLMLFCAAYKVMTSASTALASGALNANDFTGFTLNGGTAPGRGQAIITINYGRYNGAAAPSLDPAGAGAMNFASNVNITAAATPTLTYSNDLLVGIFATFSVNSIPFKCPTGMTKRVDSGLGGQYSGLFICDMQLSGTTAGPLVATQNSAQYASGVLIPIHPN